MKITEREREIFRLIFEIDARGETPLGREIRRELNERGFKIGIVSFYFLMSDLEENEFVTGFEVPPTDERVTYASRAYNLTGHGLAEIRKEVYK